MKYLSLSWLGLKSILRISIHSRFKLVQKQFVLVVFTIQVDVTLLKCMRKVIITSQDLIGISNNKLVTVILRRGRKRRGPTVIYGPLLMRYRQQMFRYHIFRLSFIKFQRLVSSSCFDFSAQSPTFYNVYTHKWRVFGTWSTFIMTRILSPSCAVVTF